MKYFAKATKSPFHHLNFRQHDFCGVWKSFNLKNDQEKVSETINTVFGVCTHTIM
jgi:hypothetical protein